MAKEKPLKIGSTGRSVEFDELDIVDAQGIEAEIGSLTFGAGGQTRAELQDDGKFVIKHASIADLDLIIDVNNPITTSIEKRGASGALQMMPNAQTLQWLAADPTAPSGVNRFFIDVQEEGDLYLQTLPGAGASGEVIATDGAPLRPDNDGTSDLGRADKQWKDVHALEFIGSGDQLTDLGSIGIHSDVDTTIKAPEDGDWLRYNGTSGKWERTAFPRFKNDALCYGDIGSASNAANQQFDLDLSGFNLIIGDVIRIGLIHLRGDLSSDGTEYLDVGFVNTSNPKSRHGEDGYNDNAVLRTSGNAIDETYTVQDIGGGTPGLSVFVSPSSQVNFSPSGMPNGWWWQIKVDILQL